MPMQGPPLHVALLGARDSSLAALGVLAWAFLLKVSYGTIEERHFWQRINHVLS